MTNPVADVPAKSVRPLYLAAGASGLLLYVSFFPLNLGFLAWVALVPLLVLVRADARPKHIYRAAFVGGLVFYVPAIQWMRVAHPAMYGTWAILSLYSALYFPLGLWLIRKLDRAAVPLTLAVPAVWVGLEYLRMHFPTGFPFLEGTALLNRIGFGWYFLGYTQHDALPVIQVADLAGVYGVSFLIVLVNAVLFQWVSSLTATVPAKRPLVGTAAAALQLAGTLTYGYHRLDHAAFEQGPRVALLQSNLPQSVKMGPNRKTVREHMGNLLKDALSNSPDEAPDLVIWPETTSDEDWVDVEPGVDPRQTPPAWQYDITVSRLFAIGLSGRLTNHVFSKEGAELHDFDYFARITAGRATNQLIGLHGLVLDADGKAWKYNTAKLVNRDGTPGPRYDKMHLVPFGEYVPLRNTFPFLKALTPYSGDYSCKPGEHWTRFPLAVGVKTYHFGCVICYEDSDPSLARNYARESAEGPAADFLVNISNDGWFNGTEEHEQHLAICRFRAVECRRPVVRAVNMGISGIIDGDGRVVKIPGATWSESKKTAAVVNGPVPLDRRESWYARLGDWVPGVCWAAIAAGLVLGFRRRGAAA
jgi:apolipoprotein N-acyltransferase